VSQLALTLGSWISPGLRERIEALTSPGLAILGGYQLTGELIHTMALTPPTTAVLTTVLLIPATIIIYRTRPRTPLPTPPTKPPPPATTPTQTNSAGTTSRPHTEARSSASAHDHCP